MENRRKNYKKYHSVYHRRRCLNVKKFSANLLKSNKNLSNVQNKCK